MSRFSLFAFVEGKEIDPNFFAQICDRVCQPRAVGYQVQTSLELPGGGEGKMRLVAFYRHARLRRQLRSTLNGKLSILVFFLDKDVDEIRRRKCRSDHIIYTRYYDVESYLFRHGDFARSVAASASLDPRVLLEHPLFAQGWCEDAARRWKEWMVLCLFSVIYTKGTFANYGRTSLVNQPLNGPVSQDLYQVQLAAAHAASPLTWDQFDRAIGRLTMRINQSLSDGIYDLFFKGKWYSTILELDLRAAFPARGQMQNAGSKATTALLATLDFGGDWAEHLVKSVATLLDRY